jgi:peptidoglycan/xylan/chitin deacetylase (PgdA/CDA1 family)
VFISVTDLIEILEGRQPICPGAVWLSLDDGWNDIGRNVIPEVHRLGIPITLFLPSGIVCGDGMFWWSEADRHKQWLRSQHGITGSDLRRCAETDRRRIISELKRNTPVSLTREALSISEVRKLASSPEVTIGAHTIHHSLLPNCSSQEIEAEVVQSKSELEALIGRPVVAFAYPCGAWSEEAKRQVQIAGYRLAATTEARFISRGCDQFLVPRFCISNRISFLEAICNMTGVWRPVVDRLKGLL